MERIEIEHPDITFAERTGYPRDMWEELQKEREALLLWRNSRTGSES